MQPAVSTADLSDEMGEQVRVLAAMFTDFGGRRAFSGPAATIRCNEDASQLRDAVSQPGAGRVLVVDGGGSIRAAILGDQIAARAIADGWVGAVIYGAVRDTAVLASLDFGVRALAATPRRGRMEGPGEAQVSLSIAGAMCSPGDFVVVDADGIVILPQGLT